MNILLAFLFAIALFSLQRYLYRRYWKKGLSVSLQFSDRAAREGDRCQLREIVENRKMLPLPILRVKFSASRHLLFDDEQNSQVSDQFYRNDILSVMMYQKLTRDLDFTCGKRGFYTINRIDAVTSDIFLSTNMVEVLPCSLQLSVYPKLITGEEFSILFQKLFGTVLAKRVLTEDPFEFRGIREYQPFDSMRSVNFKASAKTGSLKVNQHDYTSSQQVSLLLNLELSTIWQYDELLEEGMRLASTLAGSFVEKGIPVSLISNGCDSTNNEPISIPAGSGRGHDTTIDEALCRIDTGKPISPFLPILTNLAQDTDQNAIRSTTIILISTYEREDFVREIQTLIETGISFFWIAPLHDDMELELPDDVMSHVLRWNVERR